MNPIAAIICGHNGSTSIPILRLHIINEGRMMDLALNCPSTRETVGALRSTACYGFLRWRALKFRHLVKWSQSVFLLLSRASEVLPEAEPLTTFLYSCYCLSFARSKGFSRRFSRSPEEGYVHVCIPVRARGVITVTSTSMPRVCGANYSRGAECVFHTSCAIGDRGDKPSR